MNMRALGLLWFACMTVACTSETAADRLVGNYLVTTDSGPAFVAGGDWLPGEGVGAYLVLQLDSSGALTMADPSCLSCGTPDLVADGVGGFGSAVGFTYSSRTGPACSTATPCDCGMHYNEEHVRRGTGSAIDVEVEFGEVMLTDATSCSTSDAVAIAGNSSQVSTWTITATPVAEVPPADEGSGSSQ
jgi:hypothetical protein